MNNNSIIERYSDELTKVEYITNPAVAREKEIKELILILLTPEKSGILVGKPGIGKTAIVEGLAYKIICNDVPDALKGYRILRINTTALLGNTDGENRVYLLMNELKQQQKLILFIDEIHTLIGNEATGALDLANMFKEGLGRGDIKMIGATTEAEYERYIVRDKAFMRRFEKVDVLEPTKEMCCEIVFKTLPKIEKQTGVIMPYTDFIKEKIIKFVVDMTDEFKRIYEVSSRYPDIALVIIRQMYSNAIYNNRKSVSFKDIYDAIRFTKAVYPDVIKKDLVVFAEEFKDELKAENIVVDANNYLHE